MKKAIMKKLAAVLAAVFVLASFGFAAAEGTERATSFVETGLTRAQAVEKCAPSVVAIDITYLVNNSSMSSMDPFSMFGGMFGYGYGYGYGNGYGNYNTREAKASGSGVIVSADGYIATCAHVVEDATSITVTLNNEEKYEAELIGSDAALDIAIIKIEAPDLCAAEIGDSDALIIGEDVVAIGNPLGELMGTCTSGIISAGKRTITVEGQEMTLIQTDAAINSGNSGGGLFNAEGKLIGIVNAKVSSSGVEGLGFAIPIKDVEAEINDLMNFGYVTGKAYLGVYSQDVTLRFDYGSRSDKGRTAVQIVDVVKGSAAEKAGIEAGDLILRVDGKDVTSATVLSDIVGSYKTGDTVKILIQRDGIQSEIEVTFGEYVPEETTATEK